jgi:2,4-dienoyl-CoA reductase-like NADH-dependent reductase (Old Yellow Enzyme family)
VAHQHRHRPEERRGDQHQRRHHHPRHHPLPGPHQAENAGIAIAALRAWNPGWLNDAAIARGVAAAEWPARHVGVRISPNGVFNDMGSPNFREQFTHAATVLDRCGLAYLHVVDGLGFGFHNLGEPMTLAEFRRCFHGALMGNCGYTFESAEHAVAAGVADLIAFGRPFISNPDLVERFRNGWPLATPADMATWYSPTGAAGYTDFPTYAPG